jgi:hypothetical protein
MCISPARVIFALKSKTAACTHSWLSVRLTWSITVNCLATRCTSGYRLQLITRLSAHDSFDVFLDDGRHSAQGVLPLHGPPGALAAAHSTRGILVRLPQQGPQVVLVGVRPPVARPGPERR